VFYSMDTDILVTVGLYQADQESTNIQSQLVNVSAQRVIKHPNYDCETLENDIAIVRLPGNFTMNGED
jgi:secreted trypsin-like serine protease